MATEDPGRAAQGPALTALPRVEDLPTAAQGYDPERVQEAFDAFRRHATQLQVQLRVLQAAGRSGQVEPSGHAVRMDSLHLIRAAAEMADTIERDAQNASANQLRITEEEVTRRHTDLREREAAVEHFRAESERERAEMLNATKTETRQLLAEAQREASQELSEAEARGARLLEQARHQATELTNSARAEVEQTLEWARAQAGAVLARAQQGAEQLLAAAGLGDEPLTRAVDSIVAAAEAAAEASRATTSPVRRPASVPEAPAPARDEPDDGPDLAPSEPPTTPAPEAGGAVEEPPVSPPVEAPHESSGTAESGDEKTQDER